MGKRLRCWTILNRDGSLCPWAGAFTRRDSAWHAATMGLMGAYDYKRLTPKERRLLLYREGVRVVRAVLTVERATTETNKQ